jgi:hypothetical protein
VAHASDFRAGLLSPTAASIVVTAILTVVAGCSSGSSAPPPPALVISTTSLADGLVGTPYSAGLAATGGTPPYSWNVSTGALPGGLSLAQASGAISGTPTASADAVALTFSVTDSGSPAQKQSAKFSLTIAKPVISVAISPARAAIVVKQSLQLTPSTSDGSSVTWSATGSSCNGATCGTFSAATGQSGVASAYTAPATAGLYTITATSSADSSKSANVTVAVTDLAGVTTYHNDLARDGANTQEYSLTAATVASASFGKLFSCAVDGAVYVQALWMPGLPIGSAKHNVVFVATQHDSLYAFDADSAAGGCKPLWHANLIDSAHGASAGEATVPSGIPGALVGQGYGDIAPEVGVTGTPVVDPATSTLYVVSKSVLLSSTTFFQRLHAIDLLTGREKFSGPVTIAATFPGSGDGGTTTTFRPGQQNQRAGLALVNGKIYIAWSSHEDTPPYYGWVMSYDARTLAQLSVFNDTPDLGWGGIWMGGGAPSADSDGNLYLITGNATFDASSVIAPNRDYGDSLLKLTPALTVAQYFTPSDEASDNTNDSDFGSGGTAILVDLPAQGSNPTHLLVGGGKDGALYLLDRDKLGGVGDSNAWQHFSLGASIFSTGAFWNSNIYIAGWGGPLTAYTVDPSSAQIHPTASSTSANSFGFPGSTPSVSATRSANGIVWSLDNGQYCTQQSSGCGPAVLHAYDATNLGKEIWNSSQDPKNAAGFAVKFTVPTIANGRVYVGTRGNNTGGIATTTSTPGELDVYGVLPN